jgi:hypothetical protein
MAVEAAVGEPGVLHQVRHADAVEPALAKQLRRDLEDPLAVRRRLFPSDFHLYLRVPCFNCSLTG